MIRKLCSSVYRWWSPKYEIYNTRDGCTLKKGLSRSEAIDLTSEWNDEAQYMLSQNWDYSYGHFSWRVEQ